MIVTDLKKTLFLGLYEINVKKIVKNFKFSFEIHEWNRVEISKIAVTCDIGIIPIDLNNIRANYKSQNKLIFMWKIGLPVVVSATPSYKNTMKFFKIKMFAKTTQDWINILNNFYKFKNNKLHNSKKRVDEMIKKHYSKKKLLSDWSKVFKSLGIIFKY